MVIVLAIGKTILILLLVIVCILAAILFFPVRYEADADIDEKCADVRISWLFRLVRFRFHAGEQMNAVLSILFFQIDFTSPEAKKKRAEKRAKKDAKKAARARRKIEKKHSGKKNAEERKAPGQERFETEVKTEPQTLDKTPDMEKQGEKFAGQTPDFAAGTMSEEKPSVKNKLSDAAGTVRDAAGKISDAKEKASGLGKTAKRIIGLVKKYEVFEIAWPKIVRFLTRICPRRLSGWVAFGLEDPAMTGQLVGALAMVPIFYKTDLIIDPDFEADEMYVNGQVSVRGYLLLIWMAALAIGLIREKNIRCFAGDLRHGRQP